MAALALLGATAGTAQEAGRPLQAADTLSAETIALGKRIFEGRAARGICFTCHATTAKGVMGLGPDLTDKEWLHGDGSFEFIKGIVKTGVPKPKKSGAIMPPLGGSSLKPDQMHAVAAYVYSLSHAAK